MEHWRSQPTSEVPQHPRFGRRAALQAGAIGLLGLGMDHLHALRALPASNVGTAAHRAWDTGSQGSVGHLHLPLGGIVSARQLRSETRAPADIRGEFKPIATSTPGLSICEHLPRLAQRSHLWALVRSLTHSTNDHSAGHMIMLSGRSDLPPGFDPGKARPSDWPSMAAVAGALTRPRNNLPPAVVLPEKLIHNTGRVIPGQFAGEMGPQRDPWFIEASPFDPNAYGAFPAYEFDHQQRPQPRARSRGSRLPACLCPRD